MRGDLGLSYQTIADACGVKWQTVQQWCKDEGDGGTDPKLANLEPLARVLNTTPWYLLFGVEVGGNPPIRGEKPLLSDEADDLIQWVIRLDKVGGEARKTFVHHVGLLKFAEGVMEMHDSDVARELAKESRELERHIEPLGAGEHANRKRK